MSEFGWQNTFLVGWLKTINMDTDRKSINLCILTQVKALYVTSQACETIGFLLGSYYFLNCSSEHFARSCPGRVLKEYQSIASLQNNSSEIVDVRKFYQGCGHTVHNGSFYYHIAGTSSIAR